MTRWEAALQSDAGRRWARIYGIVVTGACVGLAVTAAAALLYGCYYGFVHFACGTSGDYARYVNMMWNTAHGRPFVYGMTLSYLKVHLSFTLGLLGYLFWIWDAPFLLMFLQWFSLILGAVLLWAAAVRFKIPYRFTAAVLLFWTAYHFTQSTVLCEFHGTSMYYVLIPFLYYMGMFQKGLVGIPLVLILGLREEAGIIAIPLLLYLARKERWRAGYVYAALTVAYLALAVFVLYPAVNGSGLAANREEEMSLLKTVDSPKFWAGMVDRLRSMGWILLPVAPLLLKGWGPLLMIPAVAVLVTMASSYPHQYSLDIHYPAVITACMGVAMIEAGRRLYDAESSRLVSVARAVFPLYMIVVAVISHGQHGHLQGYHEKKWKDRRHGEDQDGRHALWVARHHLPETGAVLTERRLAGFIGNRPDYLRQDVRTKAPPPPEADVIFCRSGKIPDACREGMRTNAWGVKYFDDGYVVLQRGSPSALNADCLRMADAAAVVRVAFTAGRAGDMFVPGEGLVRHWRGDTSRRPMLSRSLPVALEDGDYRVTLRFRSGKPGVDQGRIRLLDDASNRSVLETSLSPPTSDAAGFREQSMPLRVTGAQKIAVEIEGAAAPLWLRRIVFERAAPVTAPEG